MRKAALLALTAAPFIAVAAGIIAAKLAPALMRQPPASAAHTNADSGAGKANR